MYPLYPSIKPYTNYNLPVGKPHVLYVEETGNPQGVPVIVLHAGPGAGGEIYLRRFFDPEVYRIIIFDQRGCGRSMPAGETKNNTTQLLIEDIETLRIHLNLSKIILFGGGWGSLLSLLYAKQYPANVHSLLLYQIFLGTRQEVDWFYHQGTSLIYPDYWEEFISIVPETHRHQIIDYYTQCLQGNNELARMSAAKNWALWNARCSGLQPQMTAIEESHEPHFAVTFATIQLHYIRNHFFIKDQEVLNNIDSIQHLPTYLIHGRYDMISPLASAWILHKVLPGSTLSIIRDAGHFAQEASFVDALIMASKQLLRQNPETA